jgi:hypothetical protein
LAGGGVRTAGWPIWTPLTSVSVTLAGGGGSEWMISGGIVLVVVAASGRRVVTVVEVGLDRVVGVFSVEPSQQHLGRSSSVGGGPSQYGPSGSSLQVVVEVVPSREA